ncbi:hypothetical protein NDU88_001393 [Pleurodeles waltl]|uniref:Uncharacterized protein n=1 Tax=Pleurodeles waltl TaxID=8319 RepID=A0AAV7UU74_PLEWA|nr:hypothetical protein NDU88_001393 [Pleurodeles waltl]
MLAVQNASGNPHDVSVAAILGAHTQKFDDILNAVQNNKSTLQPNIDALCIDVGHLREVHKKLKDGVASTERAVAELHPPDECYPAHQGLAKRGFAP